MKVFIIFLRSDKSHVSGFGCFAARHRHMRHQHSEVVQEGQALALYVALYGETLFFLKLFVYCTTFIIDWKISTAENILTLSGLYNRLSEKSVRLTVCCAVRGRALASHTGARRFESRGGRLSSSIR